MNLNIENPDKAFENAIRLGMNNPDDWMYMYSKEGYDYFKHHDTRGYCRYPSGPTTLQTLCYKVKNTINSLL